MDSRVAAIFFLVLFAGTFIALIQVSFLKNSDTESASAQLAPVDQLNEIRREHTEMKADIRDTTTIVRDNEQLLHDISNKIDNSEARRASSDDSHMTILLTILAATASLGGGATIQSLKKKKSTSE